MRRSIQIAIGLIGANFAMMTGPGMVVYGFGGAPIAHWLPPITNPFDFALSGLAGLLWPPGIPLAILALGRWKTRWRTGFYWLAVVALWYLWAIAVAAFVHLTLGHVIPMPVINGQALQLDRSSDVTGPDKDHNGIRDDVDAWIAAQPITAAQKRAAQQAARVVQTKLVIDLTNKTELDRLDDMSMRSLSCLGDVFMPRFQKGSELDSQIDAITINTEERAGRHGAYNRAAAGGSHSLPEGENCEP